MENINNIQDFQQQEESIDIKALFFKFYRYWYLFALTVFVTLIIAFVFNKYTASIYEVSSTVLIQDKQSSSFDVQSLIGFGMGKAQQNLENEIGILQSYSLTSRTVKKLDFDISLK